MRANMSVIRRAGRTLLRPLAARVIPPPCRRQSSDTYLESFILQHTEVGTDHLTPELRLLLLTPRCSYWRLRPEHWPYSDPYWAIYWPGGQALARYLLDHPEIVQHKRVLDLGCGCGATAIAAQMGGASYVLANDIDPVAGTALALNCRLNGQEPLHFLSEDMIGGDECRWGLITLGDMFYEEQLADRLHPWLRRCTERYGTAVLIGDPGRGQFVDHPIQKWLQKLAEYSLPESSKQENFGLTSTAVWRYRP
ncbi:electron transfer flavoprotein beta subunit lysine methyltransferase [Hyperolius riggenbachi]|uniref:electron transfer flavoprotein beta subunit lysine methyltransferase n=1 Tax=Hyperolius riggenbachi TaxID=752182 RepID=UPI0035A3BC0A